MQNVIQENEKRYPRFANFGEYLFWSYANLQMLCAALNMGKAKYEHDVPKAHRQTPMGILNFSFLRIFLFTQCTTFAPPNKAH